MYFTAVGELQYQSYQLDAMTINNNALVIISQLAFSTAVPIIAINNIDMSWAVVATAKIYIKTTSWELFQKY